MAARAVVLTGFESAGKSALFRVLTGEAAGDEANFRGSTVVCRRGRLVGTDGEVVDTPGIRLASDSETTRQALAAVAAADTVLLVARSTQAHAEVTGLLRAAGLGSRRAALALTFADRAPADAPKLVAHYERELGVPVVAVNARDGSPASRAELIRALHAARQVRPGSVAVPPVPVILPRDSVFEYPLLGPWLAVLWLVVMYAVPVYLAYAVAQAAQPVVDAAVIEPLKTQLAKLPAVWFALLGGSYGVLTLGWYSFLWAFPVVLFIGVSTAFNEETGLKDRVTAALDPWLRRTGLSGRDLLPVLTGYGCNVVAVLQSRSCSRCTRSACVSWIAFGSACSYQIGASLSIFGAAGRPWLFAPYLVTLFFVGAWHTRLWHGALPEGEARPVAERAFLQWPSARAIWWRVRTVRKQFLLQAMPVFLLICLVAAAMESAGVMRWLCEVTAPVWSWFRLPPEVAPGVLFSVLRKDGLLTLNQGEGGLLRTLDVGQTLVLVWLASTFSACLVTLWTVGRELGARQALRVAGRQALTAVGTALVMGLVAW
jgi:Fe2+ transport system protein B